MTVEGHHERAADDVAAAVRDLEGLIAAHVGPVASISAILDRDARTFDGLDAESGRR